ncbi:MAG: transcriptional repressor [Nitrospinae bacterium]|nr:transcriptional repressor [Nitrospinota bacterium]
MPNSDGVVRVPRRQKGIVLTPQRLCVYETLSGMTGHPNIEEVHRSALKKMPTLSLNTVYSALSWLEGNGFVSAVPLRGAPKRYDSVMTGHHHLICVKCGKITDISDDVFSEKSLPSKIRKNHSVLGVDVIVKTVCGECK